MSKQTFDIFDGAGMGLATVTFYNMGVTTANKEAVKIAKSLSDDWAVSYKEPKLAINSDAAQFIADHVEVRS